MLRALAPFSETALYRHTHVDNENFKGKQNEKLLVSTEISVFKNKPLDKILIIIN